MASLGRQGLEATTNTTMEWAMNVSAALGGTTETVDAVPSERHMLMALLERAPVSVYFKDREGRFILASRGQYERLGCANLEEIVGKHDRDFFDPEHADKATADELALLEGRVEVVDCIE